MEYGTYICAEICADYGESAPSRLAHISLLSCGRQKFAWSFCSLYPCEQNIIEFSRYNGEGVQFNQISNHCIQLDA